MKDYPTPKYEQHHEAIWERHKDGRRILFLGEVVDLLNEQERCLAECREALSIAIDCMENVDGANDCSRGINACEEALTNTAPKL